MWYKISLFLLGLFLVFVGKHFRIMHWPYAKPIYFSGLALCIVMIVLLTYGMVKKNSIHQTMNKKQKIALICLAVAVVLAIELIILHYKRPHVTFRISNVEVGSEPKGSAIK